MKKILVIGSGFAGLSAASFLAREGYDVTVVEQHNIAGGRARQLKEEGFTFDMGPSWYWMPDVFERYFSLLGAKRSDYYDLVRLDPSYRLYWPEGMDDIPADYNELKDFFEQKEKGAGEKLDAFMKQAAYKYETGINKLVHKPGQSVTEFLDISLALGVIKLDVFTSMRKHVAKFFKHEDLRKLMEFPVLFLGALPNDIPALYSLMNYADSVGGTWYPPGGMYKVVQGMYDLAKKLGVQFLFNAEVTKINLTGSIATGINYRNRVSGKIHSLQAAAIIANADYHFVETKLLPSSHRSYSDNYWESRVMAPSSLLYYVGINKKLEDLQHHCLFFDVDFDKHGGEIYTSKKWPESPLFYVSATSVTDSATAPHGYENLFFLIPVAAGLEGDTEALRKTYFDKIVARFEDRIKQKIADNVVYYKSYAVSDFVADYNAYKGNAYGLANTLRQTAILKPSMHSKKVKNLFFTGQLTVPGPGVPPSLISGEVVAGEIKKHFGKSKIAAV